MRETRTRRIEQIPLAAGTIQHGAVTELDHLAQLVARLSAEDWSRPSAVEGWTVGDVVAHLDLFVGLYGWFLGRVLEGGGTSSTAKLVGKIIDSIMPSAAPVFDTINGAIPKVVGRLMPSERVKRLFAAGARNTRNRLQQISPGDYTRPVYIEGGPYPLTFYLAVIVNELAIHGWDIESAITDAADLTDAARSVLPWFYWSSTRLMFRPARGTSGTVQVILAEPPSAMWWSMADGTIALGHPTASHPDVRIRGPAGAFALALAGRVPHAEVVASTLSVDGDRDLAERFLSNWHLI